METAWHEVETRVRGRVMLKVNAKDVPNTTLYSFRVGTTQLLEDGNTRVSAHISILDVDDAIELLYEAKARYYPGEAARRTRGIGQQYRRTRAKPPEAR